MERRVLIAVALSFVVLYGYQALFVPTSPPPDTAPQTQTPPRETASASAAPSASPEPEQAPAAAPPAIEALVSDVREREIVVETTTLQAVFTNRGGNLLHWRLKNYRDTTGRPLDLVPSDIPADQPKTFALEVEDQAVTERLGDALFRASDEGRGRLDATLAGATLVFEYQGADGLRASKEFRFEPEGYVLTLSASATQAERSLNPAIAWGPGLGDEGATSGGGSFFTGNYVQPPQAIYHRDGDVERIASADLANQAVHEGQFRFVGMDDHYFLAVAVNPGRARVTYRPLALPAPGEMQRLLLAQAFTFEPPANVRFFFGPKQFDLLREVDAELVRAINFGIFAWLAVPLLGALTSIYGVVGNFGWAIIVLTILINLAIFPLRHKSVVSMRKMQILQPQLKAIQDRYAGLKVTDPARQKMNTEIMNLYREKGVNPASGCVPMLLTMPVLFAFYSLLSQAIELRGAGFGLWITDLSQHDPYYVTPVLMGASMFWQQKITPTTMDPAQQRVMMIMPLMFSFMFLWAPSGLVVYWFVSQLWAIGQQYFTNWWIGPAPVHAVRPPAERRLKNAGTGRTSDAEKRS